MTLCGACSHSLKIRDTGATGEIRYHRDIVMPLLPSEYFRRQCWVGISQPGPDDAKVLDSFGHDRFMWGSDYPHDEGTFPFTTQHLRQIFHDRTEDVMRDLLANNVAALYDFDLPALKSLADKFGPTVAELRVPLDKLPEHPNDALVRGAGR